MDCSSPTWELKMIAQAKEELQVLETQYPNRFDYLKLELKSFIFLLESQQLMLHQYNNKTHHPVDSSPTSSASTQASSSQKKRKKSRSDEMRDKHKLHKGSCLESRDRVDVVLEKAEACLRKIQELKTSLC